MNKRDDARPLACREPIGEIEDDAGEEARFGHAEQEAHHVEAGLPADQGHGGGDHPPAHHDARDPDARAESLQREIARDLEQQIADEEDAGAGAEHRRREAEILIHGESGETDIHPVEEIHRVAEAKKREEAARGLGDGAPCRLVLVHRLCLESSCPDVIRTSMPLPRRSWISQRNGHLPADSRRALRPLWEYPRPAKQLIRMALWRTLKWR